MSVHRCVMHLHEYIETHGTTVTEFARLIGVSRVMVHSYMGGAKRKQPSLKTLQKIHEITGGLVRAEDFYPLNTPSSVPKRNGKGNSNRPEVLG